MQSWSESGQRLNIFRQVNAGFLRVGARTPTPRLALRSAPGFPLYGVRQVLPPPSSFAVLHSLRSLRSLALVGFSSPHSPSRSDSALLRIPSGFLLGGGFCPVRRATVDSSLALSARFSRFDSSRLPAVSPPGRPPPPPVSLVPRSPLVGRSGDMLPPLPMTEQVFTLLLPPVALREQNTRFLIDLRDFLIGRVPELSKIFIFA